MNIDGILSIFYLVFLGFIVPKNSFFLHLVSKKLDLSIPTIFK